MASICTYYEPNCGSTSLCDQNCGVQPADRQTDRMAHTGTGKSLKTEGPKILSNDIFYCDHWRSNMNVLKYRYNIIYQEDIPFSRIRYDQKPRQAT